MRIRYQLLLLTAIPFLIVTVFQAYNYALLVKDIDKISETIVIPFIKNSEHANDVRFLSSRTALAIDRAIIALAVGDAESANEEVKAIRDLRQQQSAELEELRQLASLPTALADTANVILLNKLVISIKEADPVLEEILQEIQTLIAAPTPASATYRRELELIREVNNELKPLHENIFSQAELFLEHTAKKVAESEKFVKQSEQKRLRQSYIVIISSTILFFVFFYFINRALVKKIEDLTEQMSLFRHGKQEGIKKIRYKEDEILILTNQFSQMMMRIENYENKLKKNVQQLKSLDQQKDQFMSIVSHELKTPMTSVMLQAGMLLKKSFGKLNSEQKKSLEIIIRNLKLFSKLVGEILNLSVIRAKSFSLKLEKAQILGAINEVAANMRVKAEEKGIGLKIRAVKLPRVMMDKSRIVEVLTNLIDNAIKFTEKGEIIVEAAKDNDSILVKVKDTGIGIPKDEIKEIFKPFIQIKPSYEVKEKGTRLGLSICKGIIEKHGGKIFVESTWGTGSTFYFTIPLNIKTHRR